MRYRRTLMQAARFALVFRAAALFILVPLLHAFVQSYLESSSDGLVFNTDVFQVFLSPRGILSFLLAFLAAGCLICFETGMLIHIVRSRGRYPLRQAAKVTAHGMASLLHPTLPLAACYYVLFLPLVHVGYVSGLVPTVNIPPFVYGEMSKTHIGQIGALLLVCAYHALFLLMLFAPMYMAIQRRPIHSAFLKSARLFTRLTHGERLELVLEVSAWAYAESLVRRFMPLRILSNEDFNLYFLKLLVKSSRFRLEVLQYAVLTVVLVLLSTLFLMRLHALFVRHEADAGDFAAGTRSEALVERAVDSALRLAHVTVSAARRAASAVRGSAFIRRHPLLVRAAVAAIVLLAAGQYLSEAPRIHRPWVIGHRGCIYEAENSTEAIRAAAAAGADFAEIDVQLSSDGVPVVIHDANLLRLCGRMDEVSGLTADELTALTVTTFSGSAPIPTLDQAIEAAKASGVGLLIELKTSEGNAAELAEAVERAVLRADFADDALFMSLDYEAVRILQARHPQWWIGYCVISSMGDLDYAIWDYDIDFLAVEESLVSHLLLTQARAHWIPVYVWTVDDEIAMQNALQLGVSGLITDDPETARAYVDAYWADHAEYTVYEGTGYPKGEDFSSGAGDGDDPALDTDR